MVSIADDIVGEHRRLADTLEVVGPDAPGGVGTWVAEDLAAHLMAQRAAGGVGVFFGRLLAAHGVRLPTVAALATARAIPFYRKKGFRAALMSLREGPPRLLLRPVVAGVSLAEVWLHHDDLRRANNLDPPDEPETLDAAVEFARRYQRRALRTTTIDHTAPRGDLLRWLAGRPSSIPAHQPPLRF